MMHRAFRIVLATIKWFAILGGAALLVVLLVNSRDEELTSEARSLAEFRRPSVPDAQNAYLALVGFDAPTGVDRLPRAPVSWQTRRGGIERSVGARARV